MPVLRRILILVLAVLLLGVGLGWAGSRVYLLWRSTVLPETRERTTAPEPPPSPDIRPIEEEDARTAGLPLAQALESLDYRHDPRAFHALQVIVQSRVRQERFEELEACAAAARSRGTRLPGGEWVLYRLVREAGRYAGGTDRPDGDWEAYQAHLQAWQRRCPGSLAARVACAEFLTAFAWKARGSGWASTVTHEGWRLFGARLQQARVLLEAVPERLRTCPMWYRTMLTVALGQGWERADYDRLFEAAVAVEPRFQYFYTARAYSLLPRWHGAEGEWEAFATRSADRLGGAQGDAIFYWILTEQSTYHEARAFSQQHKDAWPRMKRGFAAIEASWGATDTMLHQYCRAAGWYCDRATAQAMLARLGDGWCEEVWGSRGSLADFKDWAYRRGKYVNAP